MPVTFGPYLPDGTTSPFRRSAAPHLESLPALGARGLRELLDHSRVLDERVAQWEHEIEQHARWVLRVRERPGYQGACVAIATKRARIIWAMLAKNEPSRLG
jgi:hypothetical protein